jgi:glycosyltransferase involved in cell wall biosynthesis
MTGSWNAVGGGQARPPAPLDMLGPVMSDRPHISVVVPFHNSECYLADCIESLLAQRDAGAAFEVILVDNGSTDGSASVAAQFDDIIVLEEPVPGAYAARNTGIRQAQAPLIAFTDSDCVVAPDWLQSIQNGLQDPAAAILLGRCSYPSNASWGLRLLGAYENAKADYVINRCPAAHHFAYTNNMAVRACVFEEIGLFLQWQRAADSELLHRLASRRPDLHPVYHPSMKVTHMEFLRARDRARRLSLYTKTNSRIETFRELSVAQRAGLLLFLMRGGRAEE